MYLVWMIYFFVFRCVLGSFFNVVGLRVPKNILFSHNRSYCPACKKQLQCYELIPIASYLFQHGQCRNCQTRISPIYPVIELSTGLLFVLAYWKVGFTFELIATLLFISLLMIVFVTDITYMLIPNKILLFFLPLFAFMRIISPLDPWYDALIGAGLGFVLLASIIILSKGGMGGGDMKLFAVLGIVLGWKGTLLTLFLASFLGAIFGLFLITINKVNRKQLIPFGPYIVIAALISYFYGDQVISMYLSLF